MRNFLRWWLPMIAWCVVLFVQSAFPTPESVPDLPQLDKVFHVGAYALLGFLAARAFGSLSGWQGKGIRLVIAATLAASLYGLSDEWHQSFVAVRTADAADLVADMAGGLLGSIAYLRAAAFFKRKPAVRTPIV